MVTTHLRLPLAIAGVLLIAACGGTDDPTEGGSAAPSVAEDACAQLGLAAVIEKELGGTATVLGDSVKKDGDTTRVQCVWNTPAPDISQAGAIVELVVDAAPNREIDQIWEKTEALDVAPADWRPATRIETTDAIPKGEWESAKGSDYTHPIAGAGAIRQLSFRAGQGDDFVAHVTVRMDGKGAGSPAPAAVADAALAAVPSLFE